MFAAALAIAPVSSYFLSKNYLWDGAWRRMWCARERVFTRSTGNTVLAAITAIVSANIILVTFIVMSIRDERAALPVAPTSQQESKKDR